MASRTSPDQERDSNGEIHLQSDLADPGSVAGVFAKVRGLLGPPSVVVYIGESALCSKNSGLKGIDRLTWCGIHDAAAVNTPNPPQDPLSISVPLCSLPQP